MRSHLLASTALLALLTTPAVAGHNEPVGPAQLRGLLPLQGMFFAASYFTDLSCGSDQTSNAQAAIAAAGPGKFVVWPSGCILYSQTLVQQPGQRWLGAGGIATNAGTSLVFNNGSGGGTGVQLVGSGASIDGFSLINKSAASVAQTSSTAIVMSTGDNPTFQAVRNVYAQDWYNGADIESGYFWRFDHVWFRNSINYGIVVRNTNYCDNGDSLLNDVIVENDAAPAANGSAGVRYESGGGLKIIGSKFLGANYGIDVQVSPQCGTNPGTGDLIVTANSIENQSVSALRVGADTTQGPNTKTFGSVNFTSNELFEQRHAVQIMPGAYNVNITSNLFVLVDEGVDILGGDSVYVGANNFYKVNSAPVYLAPGTGATNVTIGPNQYTSAGSGKATVIDGRTVSDPSGPVDYNDRKAMVLPANTSGTAPKPVNGWQLDQQAFRGARVEVVIEGLLQNVGYVYHSQSFTLVNGGSGVLAPTVIADTQLGAKVNITLDNTTTAGSLLVGAALDSSVTGNPANITMSIKVIGQVTAFRPL